MILNFQLNRTKKFNVFLAFLLITLNQFVECLYEDQIGKFDWSSHYVGKVATGYLDDRFGQVYVATEENVVAALSADTGAIIWRQVLEKDERGLINYLHLINDDAVNTNSLRTNSREDDGGLISVSGTSLILVRGWNIRSGNLAWEWSIVPNTLFDSTDSQSYWFYDKSILYNAVPVWKDSYVSVFAYNAKTGEQINHVAANKFTLKSIVRNDCDFIGSYLTCLRNGEVISINLISGETSVLAKSSKRHEIVSAKDSFVLIDNKIFNLDTNTHLPIHITDNILHLIKNKNNQQIVLQAAIEQTIIKFKANNAENGDGVAAFESNYPEHLGAPRVIDASCKTNKKGDLVCRTVLSTINGALIQIQGGKIKWIREESMARVDSLEMIDLPLSDTEGAIEKQLKNKHEEDSIDWDIIGNFLQRISTQLNHVKHLVKTIFNVVSTHTIPSPGELTRDAFGLHTIIVVLTSTGKIFGIDNISGKQHYVTYLPDFSEFNNGQKMQIIVQRTSKHFPYPAQCTILGRHKKTGNGIIYQFNPITGKSINGGQIELNYQIRQISVLEPAQSFLKGILLLDKSNELHVIPESATALAHGTYIYSADKETGIVTGYYAEFSNKHLNAIETWQINLSGLDNSQKIIKIGSKNPIEHVHSQGRVLNDRSVLYKYINPNLVAIVTQGPDNNYKYVLNVHLVDVVSGGIVSTITHRRVRGPVNIVHSENWLVYTYYNEKVRRTELTAVELYEGNTQANSTVWTSFDAPPLPAVEQQSYIIPSNILALQETITEKGITSKHILIALSSGGIIEMPWHLLDPRRPMLGNNQPREEGTIPYLPELPLSSESVINYNQSISRIQGIYTAPSGLESTCLVVAYGLDFFITRVAPSKTYDLLKEDFDYFLITTVLLGLTVASFVVKHMSAKKTLKLAWK